MSQYDVTSMCNALVDILIDAKDSDIETLGLTKGIMHLVDDQRQNEVLSHFEKADPVTELGGSSLNAIRTLASLDAKTHFAGMVGEDKYGDMIKKRMEELNIHQSIDISTKSTGTCLVLVSPDGERTMNTNLGASRLFDKSLVPTEALKASKVFHFCGYQWDTENQIKAIEAAIEISRANNTKVSFDIADPFVVQNHKDTFLKLIEGFTDIVFANQEEARMLFDSSPEDSAKAIAKMGSIGVIKKGGEGAVIGYKDELIEISPIATTVKDTTAAGDMFAAGFLYGLTRDQNLAICGEIAATLAADVISRVGATVSDEAIAKAKNLIH